MTTWVLQLLYSSFAASFLIGAVLLSRFLLAKKAPRWVACMLWALVGVRLLIPFSIESEISVLPEIEMDRFETISETSDPVLQTQGAVSRAEVSEEDSVTESREETDTPESAAEETSDSTVSRDGQTSRVEPSHGENSVSTVVPPAGSGSADEESEEESAEAVSEDNSEDISKEISETNSENVMIPLGGAGTATPPESGGIDGYTVAGIVWACGFGGLLLFVAVQYALLHRRVAVFSLCEGGVRRCEMIDTPFVLGFFRPRVYLPFGLDAETERYVIAHERAHLRRLDHWSKLVAFLALAVHWFNPLVWLAFVLFCKDIEYACDEKVVREMNATERKAYANALLVCSMRQNVFSAFPVAFGAIGVKERIKNALSYKKPMLWVIVACVLLCAVLSVLFLTDPKGEDGVLDESFETSETSSEPSVSENSAENSDESAEESTLEEDASALYASLLYQELPGDYNPENHQKGTALSATTYQGGTVVRRNTVSEYLYVPDFSMPICGVEYEGVIHLFTQKDGIIQTARIEGDEILTGEVGLTVNGTMPNGSYTKLQDPALYCSMVSETEGYLAVFDRWSGRLSLDHVLKTNDGGKSWSVQPKDILFSLQEDRDVSRVQFFEKDLGVVISTDGTTDIPARVTSNGGKNWESCMWSIDYPQWSSSAESRKITSFTHRDGTYTMVASVLYEGKQYQIKYQSTDFLRWELASDSFAAATPIERSETPIEAHPYRYGYDASNRFLTDDPISYTVTEDEYLLLIMGEWNAPDEYIYIPAYLYKSGARHVMQANGEVLLFTASSDEDTVHLLRIGGDNTWTETYLASNLDLTKVTLDGNMLNENTGVVVVHDVNRIACVLWTYDGGKTWENAEIDDASACLAETSYLTNAHFFDKNTALLITSSGDYNVTDVLTVTFDGGKTWENVDLFMPDIGKEYTAFVTELAIEDGMYVLEMSASTVLYDDNDLRYVSADLKNWTLTTEVPNFSEGIVRDYVPENLADLKFYTFGSLEPDREPPILRAIDRGASVLYIPAWDEYIFTNERDLMTGGVSGDTVFIMKLLGDDEEGYSVELITLGDTVTRRMLLQDLLYYEPNANCYMVSETEGYFFLTGIPQDDYMDREIAYLLWTEDGGKTWTVQNDHFLRRNEKESLSVIQFFGKQTFVMTARCYYAELLEDRTVVTFDGGKTWQSFADLPYGDVSFAYTEIVEMDIFEGRYWMRVRLSQSETEEMEFYSDDLINWELGTE